MDIRIYSENPGSCIEPGGMELASDRYSITCPNCEMDAIGHTQQKVEGGSVNIYHNWFCNHCMEGGAQ